MRSVSIVINDRSEEATASLPELNISVIAWIFLMSNIPRDSIDSDFPRCEALARRVLEFLSNRSLVGQDRSSVLGSAELLPAMPNRLLNPRDHVSRVSRVGERSGRIFVLALRISRRRGLSCLMVEASSVVPCLTFAGVE